MLHVPSALLEGPFTRRAALDAAITPRALEGRRFVRLFPQVYRHREHTMTEGQWIAAAAMALPPSARLTGITRIQHLGLDFGSRRPLRFVMQGDVHPHIDGIFLHRTKQLAPDDGFAVTPAAAYLSYCRTARVIDALKVGDWLLHQHHMSRGELHDLALAAPWRAGAPEALWMLEHLDEGSRSLKESETRGLIVFSGLPAPEVNTTVPLSEGAVVIADLHFREWRTIVEYEGAQHQDDRDQYVSDIERYALLRRHHCRYVQVTREKLQCARSLIDQIHRELVAAGYDGPPPQFGDRWRSLFARIRDVLAHDRAMSRARRPAVG